MANKIKDVGRFYFKQTSNGNLLSEFSNYAGDKISTESCDLQGVNNGFLGNYRSTWQENGKPIFADLTISPNSRNSKLFTLDWKWKGGQPAFIGEGMLCDGILIGDYQDA